VRALPTGSALPAVGPWHPDESSDWNDDPALHRHKSAEEILDRLAGYCRSLNNGYLARVFSPCDGGAADRGGYIDW
jgi:hypothetical protein